MYERCYQNFDSLTMFQQSVESQSRHLCPKARHSTIIAVSPMGGGKAVGPVCCVMHLKVPRALVEKKKGLPRCS